MKILVSLTTTNSHQRDFAKVVQEIDECGLKEIAFFPTAVDSVKRQELYKLLEQSKVEKIPFIHLHSDMNISEIDYLVNQFGTEVFNIHSINSRYPFKKDLDKYADKIFLENQYCFFSHDELKKYAGICLDVCHLEDVRRNNSELYEYFKNLLLRYKCGCGHISAIKKIPLMKLVKFKLMLSYGYHHYRKLSEFDYLKKHQAYLPEILALELENSIGEQLLAKKYIEDLLN
jgi:hypothetical protein